MEARERFMLKRFIRGEGNPKVKDRIVAVGPGAAA